MLVWWNRFSGLSDAAFLMYGQQVLAGRIPYRDFHLPIPPLTVLKTAALIKVFGGFVIVPRILAMFERACLAAALFCWLASSFRLRDALLGTMVSMIVFCGDLADQLSSYHHDSVFLAVAQAPGRALLRPVLRARLPDQANHRRWNHGDALRGDPAVLRP